MLESVGSYASRELRSANLKTLKGRALKLVLILACLLACTCSALAQGWSNGYALRRTITIDHTLVPNTDQTNFPVLVSGTFSDLATTSNGGYVTSPSGYDILFTSDANGATKLPFEQESFNAATGAIIYWVQVPTVSHTVDTVFYVFYGNSSITTDQSNKTGVWDANYRAVWHLPNGSTLNTTDSTSNANNGTANGNVTASGGLIDGAAKFGGNTSDYIRVPSSSSFKPTTALTLEAWVDASSIGSWGNVLSLDYHANGSWSAPYSSYSVYFLNTASNIAFNLTTSGTANTVTSASTLPLNQWVHVVATYGSGAQKLFINGIQNGAANSVSGAIDYGTSQDLAIGETSPYYLCCAWNGLLDEVRISSIDRSADWIAAEYNNQSSPSTFAIVGSAMQAPTKPMIARLTPTRPQSREIAVLTPRRTAQLRALPACSERSHRISPFP